jgi:futalosine hydrolase
MKILLVAATRAEIALLATHFQLPEQDFVRTKEFDLLITGVGMTATAYALGKHLPNSYKLVVNLGIAGSFDTNIPLSTVVNVTSDEFSELGAENGEAFLSIDQLGFGKAKFNARNNLLNNDIDKLPKVHGITINRVHGDKNSISKVIEQCNPTVESMEGAAVLYCCEKESLPCLQVRSISNYVEPRNKERWQIGPAIKSLNEWAIRFLTNT